nr:VOC family protein [Campylobacter showae]
MNKITCICLGVRSMQRALKFYHDGLGFQTDRKDDDPPRGSGFGGITLAYNAKNKEDVASVIELVKKAGGTIVKEPQDTFWGGYHAYFADPEGYYWGGPVLNLTRTGCSNLTSCGVKALLF